MPPGAERLRSSPITYSNNARPDAAGSGSTLADSLPTPKFIWFRWVCVCSWLLILINFVILVTAAVALGSVLDVATQICGEPEVSVGGSCPDTLECFATCVDDTSLITSARMRDCFNEGCTADVACTGCIADSSTRAYNLAQRYLNSSISVTYARELMLMEVGINPTGRRLEDEEDEKDEEDEDEEADDDEVTREAGEATPAATATAAASGIASASSAAAAIAIRRPWMPELAACSCANLTTCCLLWSGAVDPGYDCDASATCNADVCGCEPERTVVAAAALAAAAVRHASALRDAASARHAAPSATGIASAPALGGAAGFAIDGTAVLLLRAAYAAARGQPVHEALAAAAAASAARDGVAGGAAGGAGPRRQLNVAATDEAYVNIAVASSLALVGAHKLEVVYGWLVALGVLMMAPAMLALSGLGNGPPHCCHEPTHVERMHKVELRCACHCAWIWGIIVLFLTALALCKFQVRSPKESFRVLLSSSESFHSLQEYGCSPRARLPPVAADARR